MAKNLLMIGIGKQPSMPPKFGAKRPMMESPAERVADAYEPEPSEPIESPAESPVESPESLGGHDLKSGAQFDASIANYHDSSARCDACNAWQGEECSIWANVTDPGGWCAVFPAESTATDAIEPVEPAVESEELSA